MQNTVNVNKRDMEMSGNMTISTFKKDIENNILLIMKNLKVEGYVDLEFNGEDKYHLYFILLDNGDLAFIYDSDTVQKQVIMNVPEDCNIININSDSDLYNLIVEKSSKIIYKEIVKNKEINGKYYKEVLNIDEATSMQIKFRLMSLLICDVVSDLLDNESIVDNIMRYEYISADKVIVLLYDPKGCKLCADIQINDVRESFFLCYPEPIDDKLDPNNLSSCILNGVIADYLSEDFGLVYAAQDGMM